MLQNCNIFLRYPYGGAESAPAIAAITGIVAAGPPANKLKTHKLPLIQQKAPDDLIGKAMAYTSAVTLCVQPIGQIVYGFLFDKFSGAVYFILIPTGFIVCAVGASSASFFGKTETERPETKEDNDLAQH